VRFPAVGLHAECMQPSGSSLIEIFFQKQEKFRKYQDPIQENDAVTSLEACVNSRRIHYQKIRLLTTKKRIDFSRATILVNQVLIAF
jgi:hypothetical protein